MVDADYIFGVVQVAISRHLLLCQALTWWAGTFRTTDRTRFGSQKSSNLT